MDASHPVWFHDHRRSAALRLHEDERSCVSQDLLIFDLRLIDTLGKVCFTVEVTSASKHSLALIYADRGEASKKNTTALPHMLSNDASPLRRDTAISDDGGDIKSQAFSI